jgi:hypothetical protein
VKVWTAGVCATPAIEAPAMTTSDQKRVMRPFQAGLKTRLYGAGFYLRTPEYSSICFARSCG